MAADPQFVLGFQGGMHLADKLFEKLFNDPGWEGQITMGFAASFGQELTERGGMGDFDDLPPRLAEAIIEIVNNPPDVTTVAVPVVRPR